MKNILSFKLIHFAILLSWHSLSVPEEVPLGVGVLDGTSDPERHSQTIVEGKGNEFWQRSSYGH